MSGSNTSTDVGLVRKPPALADHVALLYEEFGQRKEMGSSASASDRPHFFLLRTFLGENDLLTVLNTKRCRYRCAFCNLPEKSTRAWVPDEEVIAQFRHVADECRHALSILDRVTLSNEGSVLDEETLGQRALDEIVRSIGMMRRIRRIELESRVEFVTAERIRELALLAPRAHIGILTGFESADERVRNQILQKKEPLGTFVRGLDEIAAADACLTAYVLYKADQSMTDEQAYDEARASIRYLEEQCTSRNVSLAVRLNPMYVASGSRWAQVAVATPLYKPPRLTDVMKLAEETSETGVDVYIGLSTEGLADGSGTYMAREDYSSSLIKWVKLFNDKKIPRFPPSVFLGSQ